MSISIYDKMEELLVNVNNSTATKETLLLDLVLILFSCRNMSNSDGTKTMSIEDINKVRDMFLRRIETNYPGFTSEYFNNISTSPSHISEVY